MESRKPHIAGDRLSTRNILLEEICLLLRETLFSTALLLGAQESAESSIDMAHRIKCWATQVYLSAIPIGVSGYIILHSYRDISVSKYYTWRSQEPVPETVIDDLDGALAHASAEKKVRYRNTKFNISLIDNLEARTYGSFSFNTGAEFQVPTVSTVNSTSDLKQRFPNLLTLLNELNIKGELSTEIIPESQLKSILLTPAAKAFYLYREMVQAQSLSHVGIPCIVYTISMGIAFPIFKLLSCFLGGWGSLALMSPVVLYMTYEIMKAQERQRVLAMDHRVLLENKKLSTGAMDYLKARQAFGKILHKYTGSSSMFDSDGNCLKHRATYSDRMKAIEEFMAHEDPPVNVRSL